MTGRLLSGLLLGLLLFSLPAQAQQYEQVGNHQIHYSAVNTSFLPPAVARDYGIPRNQVTGLLNVSVLEVQADGSTRPVAARVDGEVGGLGTTSPSTPLAFRTLRDGDSVSQIATFRIRADEPMRFDLEVAYDRNAPPARISFIQRFYIDR